MEKVIQGIVFKTQLQVHNSVITLMTHTNTGEGFTHETHI